MGIPMSDLELGTGAKNARIFRLTLIRYQTRMDKYLRGI